MKTLLSTCVVFAALASPAAAQRTWIVDAAKGPGWHFTSIQKAVDAAKSGDVVVIRTGSYQAFSLGKGLRLLADAGVVVTASPAKPVRVRKIGSTEIAVLRGLAFLDVTGKGAVVLVEDNNGSVHFENMNTTVPLGSRTHAVVVVRSKAFTMRACIIGGGIRFASSNAMVTDSTFYRTHLPTMPPPLATIVADGGRITLARSSSIGQAGVYSSAPALSVANAMIRILGDSATSVYKAGRKVIFGGPAIIGDSKATLEYDPRVWIVPTGSNRPIVGFAWIAAKRLPHMRLAGGKLGGTIQIDLSGAPRDFYGLSLSLPASSPFLWAPFGYLWLQHATNIPVFIGLYDTTGVLSVRMNVPNVPGLRGLPVAWQAVSGPWPNIVYANAAVVTLH